MCPSTLSSLSLPTNSSHPSSHSLLPFVHFCSKWKTLASKSSFTPTNKRLSPSSWPHLATATMPLRLKMSLIFTKSMNSSAQSETQLSAVLVAFIVLTLPPKKQKGSGSFPISFDHDAENDVPLSQFIPKSGRTSRNAATPTLSAIPSAKTTAPPSTMETEPSNLVPEVAKPISPTLTQWLRTHHLRHLSLPSVGNIAPQTMLILSLV